MEIQELRVFVTVAAERSFSRAARKLGRTQPAISQAIRRLEDELGEPLVDRSARDGTLTEAGVTFREYAQRVLDLAAEAERAILELRDVQRGRVLIGSNEAAVHTLLPLVAVFQGAYPGVQVDVRRVPARQMAHEVLSRALDFGVLTFHPGERGLQSLVIGSDELVLLTSPSHPFARRRTVKLEEVGRDSVIAHNDPSPARDRVLRAYEERHAPVNITMALPSLDAIKRAVEMKMGVALLPRRCALSELALGQLSAVRVPELRIARHVRLIYRQAGERSHAAAAFLETAQTAAKSLK
ncbi:MAG: LysR family transcriptional regulator [Acidobacteria bacterium]|nr:LysR family transcriptional regulator [Acidobacteriota bacterium]